MAKKENKEEELAREMQQKYMEMSLYDQQLKQIQQQMQQIEQQAMEVEYVVQCLADMANVEPDTEILVPMSSGIFIKAKIVDTKTALINVGGNTAIEKPFSDVQDMLRIQVKELRKVQEDLAAKMQEIAHKAGKIEAEVRKLAGI